VSIAVRPIPPCVYLEFTEINPLCQGANELARGEQMDRNRRVFRECLEIAANTFRVNYGELLRARDVNDFLIDETLSPSGPREFAAKALEQLTIGDDCPMDAAVCVGVLSFLENRCGALPRHLNEERRLQDFRNVVASQLGRDEYLKIIYGWWP